jgi:peptidoglycan/LPS O-acetylase OafA/YrhL
MSPHAAAGTGRILKLLVANLQSYPAKSVSEGGARAFVTLDGLRGIAALAIAARHAPFLWPEGYPTGVLQKSYLAVDFFFVLSGFVLSHAYSSRFESGLTVRQFMIARMVRIYPLYFLAFIYSTFIAVNQFAFNNTSLSTITLDPLFAVLFIPIPFRQQLFPMNHPAWSLFFELIANAAFGWIGKRLNAWTLAAILIPAALILVLAVSFGGLGFGVMSGAMDAGFDWRSSGAGLVRVAFSFFAGALVYRLWQIAPRGWAPQPVALIAALCAILAACPGAQYQAAFDLTATLLVFPALVFLGARSKPGRHAARLFAWLGGISYGVYVLQAPVFGYAHAIAVKLGGHFGNLSLFWAAMSMVLVVAVAAVADDCFDRPIRRELTRFFARPAGRRQQREPAVSERYQAQS